MKRADVNRFFAPLILSVCSMVLCLPAVVSASSSAADSVHFCGFGHEESRRDHLRPAAKRAADLNVGEPRTVRIIYFLPNDWPYRADVVDSMKTVIKQAQTFYAEQMQAHGYGNWTFGIETDVQGEPMVHRVDGKHPFSHYDNTLGTAVVAELEQTFDLDANIYFIVLGTDALRQGSGAPAGGVGDRRTKNGGDLVVPDRFDFFTVAHELGHSFGLPHDFRDNRYIMSYGFDQHGVLSACAAEFLAAHPYFNPGVPIEAGPPPAIELTSPLTYPDDAKSVSVQLEASDSDGLHQVILSSLMFGREVKACNALAGEEEAVITFDYDGVIPSRVTIIAKYTSLSEPRTHPIRVRAVDTAGNLSEEDFVLSAIESESTRPRPQGLLKISGYDQRGEAGAALAQPLVVEVRDQYGNPLPDATVTFTVTAGEGRLSVRFTLENVTTGADGRAERTLTLGLNPGANAVEVSVGELATETFQAVGYGEPITPPRMGGDFRTWHLPAGATARLGKGSLVLRTRAVAFSPEGKTLAVARKIGVWLYDVETSRLLALLPAEKLITSMSFSPDGTALACSEQNYFGDQIKLWDVATGALNKTISVGNYWIQSVAFSPDGTLLAAGSIDNDIILLDTLTGNRVATYEGKRTNGGLNDPFSLSFSPDGKLLALVSQTTTVKLWDVTTHTQIATLEGHTYQIASIAFSPDGAILASGSWDRTINLWDVMTHQNIATLEGHTDRVNSVTFSSDGTTLVSASSDRTIKLWDAETGANVATLQGHTVGVGSVAFSPDGILASGLVDGSVKLWDVSARGVVANLEKESAVSSVAFSGDGRIIALGSDDKTVKLWNAETGTQVATLEGHTSAVTSVSFLPDGTTLASGAFQEIKLWAEGTRPNSYSLIADFFRRACYIATMTPSPNGTRIATGGWFEIVLWDVATQAQTAVASSANSLSFSPDGRQLVSLSDDGFMHLWDVATLENIATIPTVPTSGYKSGRFALFSPDGTMLATGTDYVKLGFQVGSVKLWDAVTKENIATFEERVQIKSGSFSPDGKLIASGSENGIIKLWDVEKKESVATLKGHFGSVNSLSFSPDGKTLASGSRDGTVLLWDISPFIVVAPPTPSSDFNGDGRVGFSDFLLFAGAYGTHSRQANFDSKFDLNGDGWIGFPDFVLFVNAYGKPVDG